MEKFTRREKVGAKLRILRMKAGYTSYEDFANAHGLVRQTVGRAETGGNLELDTLFNILDALKITPEEFFKGIK